MSKILLFGDICPTKYTRNSFERGDRKAVFGDILPEIESADIVIGNLECAVTDDPSPIKKAGPTLYTNSQSILTLKDFDALSLANNHVRDCGDEGVMTAIHACNGQGIRTFGAGANLESARKPIIIEKKGLKVGLMSFAEQEFNLATKNRPGACSLNLYEDFDRIREFRKTVDYLIVLYHGGIEYFAYPSPELRRKCRKMAECGADLVSCQHSHCIGTIERYHESTIVYGQGNSVFGYRKGDRGWNRGLLIEIDIEKISNEESSNIDRNITAKVTFKAMEATPNGLQWLDDDNAKELDEELQGREHTSEEVIDDEWNKFCQKSGLIHLPLLLGWPRLLIAINRRTNNSLVKLLYSRKASNITHNLIRCEAHREVIENILSKNDYR